MTLLTDRLASLLNRGRAALAECLARHSSDRDLPLAVLAPELRRLAEALDRREEQDRLCDALAHWQRADPARRAADLTRAA